MISPLRSDLGVPSPGFGTLRIEEDLIAESVATALNTGYRHVDTAQMYENQGAVGRGIDRSSVDREEILVATKILHPYLRDSVDYDQTLHDGYACLDALGTEYIDLLYIHWPADYDLEIAFDALDSLATEGVCEHLGVCNFTPELLDEARELSPLPIEVHQVEMHPLLQQQELREYGETHDITLVAYTPLIRGTAQDVPELQAIAEKHDVSAAQVSLAWIMEKGAVPIPKATSEAHIRENWAAREVQLDPSDIELIDGIDREERQIDPDFARW